MSKTLYIITGTSRGLGKAIVDVILSSNGAAEIMCIGRTLHEEHVKFKINPGFYFIEVDLADPTLLTEKMALNNDAFLRANRIIFINNAGTISPIKKIGKMDERELLVSLFVNSASPGLIINHILKVSADKELSFVNITSGAATRAIDGWAVYCAGKAYAKMFFMVLAEQEKNNPKVKIFQIDPGMLDTEMQQEIRSSDFPRRNDFSAAKEDGQLKTVQAAATHIIEEIS